MEDESTFSGGYRLPLHPSMARHQRADLHFKDERGQSVHICHKDRLTGQRIVIFRVGGTSVKLDITNALRLADDIAGSLENHPGYQQLNYCDVDYALNRVISVYAVMSRGKRFVNLKVNQRDTWLTADTAQAVVQTIRSYAETAPTEDAQPSQRPMRLTALPAPLA